MLCFAMHCVCCEVREEIIDSARKAAKYFYQKIKKYKEFSFHVCAHFRIKCITDKQTVRAEQYNECYHLEKISFVCAHAFFLYPKTNPIRILHLFSHASMSTSTHIIYCQMRGRKRDDKKPLKGLIDRKYEYFTCYMRFTIIYKKSHFYQIFFFQHQFIQMIKMLWLNEVQKSLTIAEKKYNMISHSSHNSCKYDLMEQNNSS